MNRRSFIQSLAAVLCLPANPNMSLRPLAAAMPAAIDVPARVKSWAVYMSNLHGDCTPLTLHRLLHIPEADATQYVNRLVADGVLKNPLLQQSVRKLASQDEGYLLNAVEERSEMKAQAQSTGMETSKEGVSLRCVDDGTIQPELPDEADGDVAANDGNVHNPDDPAPPQYPSSSPLIT